ncbi:hypothetical protein [Nocardioides alkalitolerans]|uniref:hypothetical protein n=1 Tax=Nocardioides alkalitolerans TaxID=281714 RepID=UPI000417B734|nr:hypothetical protein [Nocardioides alkalitolerans]
MTTNTRRHGVRTAALAAAGAVLAGSAALGAAPATAADPGATAPAAEKVAEVCPVVPLEERADAADAVVVATVSRVVNAPLESGAKPSEPVTPGLNEPTEAAKAETGGSRTVEAVVDETFRGDVRPDVSASVTVTGLAGVEGEEPAVGVSYVMFLVQDASALTATLCDLLPVTSVDAADLDALVEESTESEPVALTPVEGVDDPPSYRAAVVPGAALVAVGLLGLLGTVALGRISGRR